MTNIHTLLKNNQKDIGVLITGASPIHRETAQIFTGIIGNTDMSARLIEAYSLDAWRFAGFKTNRMIDELKAIAYENKKLIPLEKLIAKSDKLYNTYNKLYLRAEVQQANNAALASERWHSFSDDENKYLLQYRTAEDERVRAEHAILNGITLPKSDPFWSEFYPPNGWGCRCLAVEVLASQYKKTENVDTDFYKKKIFKNKNEKPFAFNPGQELRLFPPTASYYKVSNYDAINKIVNKQYYNLYLKDKLKKHKETIHPYRGIEISNKNLINGKTTILRKSVKEVVQHNVDIQVKAYTLNMIDDIDNWNYIGWSKTGIGTHPEADYFLYYKTTIDNKTRYVNVLMHKHFKTEVVYTITDKIDMNKIIKGKK